MWLGAATADCPTHVDDAMQRVRKIVIRQAGLNLDVARGDGICRCTTRDVVGKRD